MAVQTFDFGSVVGPQGEKGDTPTAAEIKAAVPAATVVAPNNTDFVTSDLLYETLNPTRTVTTITEDTSIAPAVNSQTYIESLADDSANVLTVTLPSAAAAGDKIVVFLRVADETEETFYPYPHVAMAVSAPAYVAFEETAFTADWGIAMEAVFSAGAWLVDLRGYSAPNGWGPANSTRKIVFAAGRHTSLSAAESYQMISDDQAALSGPSGMDSLFGFAPLAGWTDEQAGSSVKFDPAEVVTKSELARVTTLYPLYEISESTVDTQSGSVKNSDITPSQTYEWKTIVIQFNAPGETGAKLRIDGTFGVYYAADRGYVDCYFPGQSPHTDIWGHLQNSDPLSGTASVVVDVPADATQISIFISFTGAAYKRKMDYSFSVKMIAGDVEAED